MFDRFRRDRRKGMITTALVGSLSLSGMLATEKAQQGVNRQNQELNHAFSTEDISLESKIRELIGTSNYSGIYREAMSKKLPILAPFFRENARVGLIHLYATEMQTLEEAKEYVIKLRSENKKPFLISADIEGGLVNHLKITQGELLKFGLPVKILEERKKEYEFYLKKHKGDKGKVKDPEKYPLPSQEWLGRVYEGMSANDKKFFLEIMTGYGEAVAKVAEYIGINVVFGPNLDIVDDIDGNRPDEKNDRTYGEKIETVRDLGVAYIKGFNSVKSVIPVAKHFIGNSLSPNDPHVDTSKVSVDRRGGAVIPYRDAIRSNRDLGIMTSVTANQLYGQPNIPTAYSPAAINSLNNPKISQTPPIKFTDDLQMVSSGVYITKAADKRLKGLPASKESLSVYAALAAGNEVAFIKDIAGREDLIAREVARYIRGQVNLQGLPGTVLTEEKINYLFRRVMELKVKVGLLRKEVINGRQVYVMDPRIYNPQKSEVLWNSFLSNQWPWTSKDDAPARPQPNFVSQMTKAAKNFSLSLWRVNFPTLNPKYENKESKTKLILIDKSLRKMWIYDSASKILEESYDVAIGKGGLQDRRFVGDHVTPEGIYEIVQKRDNTFWKEEKGAELPHEYGGVEGGMLVLAGQWHPEIAIHGTDQPNNLSEVSNGCVRVPNRDIQKLMRSVPVGSMVIITK